MNRCELCNLLLYSAYRMNYAEICMDLQKPTDFLSDNQCG
jgi:hypothetical protein